MPPVHAYWTNVGPDHLLETIEPTLLGHQTGAFDFEKTRFVPRSTRFQTLSSEASLGILRLVADAGSYHYRLTYTLKRLKELENSTIHVAFAASLEQQLLILLPPHPTSILQYAANVRPYSHQLHALCRLIGCEDLSLDISLDRIPAPWELLNRVFDCSWPLFIDTIEPWMLQLSRMIEKNNSTAAQLIWAHPQVYIADMFCQRKKDRFVFTKERVPQFMPINYARMAVECLNCRCILELAVVGQGPESATKGPSRIGCTRNYGKPIDPFADTTEKQYSFTAKISLPKQEPVNIIYAVHEMMEPVVAAYKQLNQQCLEVVCPVLKTHLKLISDVILLMNGPLWVLIREELAVNVAGRPSNVQLQPINEFISTITPYRSVYIGLQMNVDLVNYRTDHLTIYYDPPHVLRTIISKPVVEACNGIFSRLLRLQQQNRQIPSAIEELSALALGVEKTVRKLELVAERETTLEGIVHEFSRIPEILASL